ncbi:RDD family protein [Aquabacter spiritensis]|uniref:Putative RDD family membrane protein YckC n=1 Tax=Aquabacter spiritensis TaxID=933073 RepID=A0A4R3LUR5_9HYPH|nr:RDD family protein [Aquabacter spiritensis]TCT02405.1 putative RDD family membrane protein YckC [Aquabacter spiritensis]
MPYTPPNQGRLSDLATDRPHAYDPVTQPEYFEGVLSRRLVAFCIDAVIIVAPIVLLAMFIFVFGIVTLSLGWMLFPVLGPAFVIWAVWYNAVTLGSPASATLGMRAMDLEMRTWYGAPAYALLGAVHAIGYWVSMSVLTPFVLLVGLFNSRRRLLHDFAVGTVIVNAEPRADALRRARF